MSAAEPVRGAPPLLRALVEALQAREPVVLVTLLEGHGETRLLVYADESQPTVEEGDPMGADILAWLESSARDALARGEHAEVTAPGGQRAFLEVQTPPAQLIICGAGHIAVPLATMAALCDYEVTVIDDRAAFASAERFPGARVRVGDFREELRALRWGRAYFPARTALVLVTRGHQHDVECLMEVIEDGLEYIGMIGSRRRIRAVFEMLQSEYGVARERFDCVYAPVGLDIGSRTPAEIAVAIVGEMINVARGGPALSLSRERSRSGERTANASAQP
jgi:xanthine dehydrogenase accessory factor